MPKIGVTQDSKRASFNEVLKRELDALRPEIVDGFTPHGYAARDESTSIADARAANLAALYARVHSADKPLSALCLSGGGIRSATFNLGVLQGLAALGVLGKFDYLSSVSGGGYIASWLHAWLHHEPGEAFATLNAQPEPAPIKHLREYSNYLTPRLGLFSGDTWSAVAIFVRNLILNWLVLVPLLAGVIVLPQTMYLFVRLDDFDTHFGVPLLIAAIAVELAASIGVHWYRRSARDRSRAAQKEAPPALRIWLLTVLPVFLSACVLSMALLGLEHPWFGTRELSDRDAFELWAFAAVWCVAVPLTGWGIVEIACRRNRVHFRVLWFEALATLVSGAVAAVIMAEIGKSWLRNFYEHPTNFVIFMLPCLLGLYLLARTLFVAISSWGERVTESDEDWPSIDQVNDADREWWARLSGWLLAIALSWMAITTVCMLGPPLLILSTKIPQALPATGGLTALIGGVTSMLAGNANDSSAKPRSSWRRNLLMGALIAAFVAGLTMSISWGIAKLGAAVFGAENLLEIPFEAGRTTVQLGWGKTWAFATAPVILFAIAVFMSWLVNVNRFSLHAFYRNRLVRAYLGASTPSSRRDPFTGFDLADNMRLADLSPRSLLPVLNMTLNLVGGSELAWQQRKAASFSASPFHCGNFREGYRDASRYGGGMTLGTALTISGAAVNPSMGFSSSPVLSFIMTMFNARLGVWLGNTNKHGDGTHALRGPRVGLKPILAELFGLATREGHYVSLSDGGHFDNLGLYEMVLRRCRYIVVSDAGVDGAATFDDLGNAIRKIRIDFGIPIAFDGRIEIFPNTSAETGTHCAHATIDYSAVDGPDAPPGLLVYFKPTLRGGARTTDYDVHSYAQTSQKFPHETTVDQWFSEAQFESYRVLGARAVENAARDPRTRDTMAKLTDSLSAK